MSIDFSTLQGLSIPEGVVKQIADASGVVLWSAVSDKVILEVEKITSDTYAAETTYTGESFILLDIYPKTNGTVNVTYGGLTKTVTDTSGAEGFNSQKVFFGTFNGVSDSVTTPASGTLTIEGDCYAVGCSVFNYADKSSKQYTGVTEIKSLGNVTEIPYQAFGSTSSGSCTKIQNVEIPNSVTTIDDCAFINCTGLTNVTVGGSVEYIGMMTFSNCTGLTSVTFTNTSGWYVTTTEGGDISTGTSVDVSDPTNNALLLSGGNDVGGYGGYYWYRQKEVS